MSYHISKEIFEYLISFTIFFIFLGGGIEMASTSIIKGCNVHVYESVRAGGYRRISAFDHPVRPETKKTVRVLYRGGVHYDALVFTE